MSTPDQDAEVGRRSGRLGSIVPIAIGLAVAVVVAIIVVPKLVQEPSDTVGAPHGTTTSRAVPTTSTTAAPVPFPFQPLFPFKSTDDARQWQTTSAKSSTD